MLRHGPRPALPLLACAFALGVACAPDRRSEPHARHVAEPLTSTQLFGESLPVKTLALTFDDGPGPFASELSQYLKSENIRAAFFVNGARIATSTLPNPNGITLTPNVSSVLAQIVADGHLVANHTTTHRDLVNEVPDGERVQELLDTDSAIAAYAPSDRRLFRAPYGSYDGTVDTTLNASAMSKYVGPVYWEAGGNSDQYPSSAADWACWQGQLYASAGGKVDLVAGMAGYATTEQCGDAYVTEIESLTKGIVLMHDPYSWAQGNTLDMVKYIVPILKGKGYSFVRVDEVPAIAAALPCDATCDTCSGPDPDECSACVAGQRYLSGGRCLACATCATGQYLSSACTATSNTVCGACDASCTTCDGPAADDCTSCPAASYLKAGVCTPCTVCGAGTYQATACTPTADAVCGACDASCATCFGPSPTQCGTCGNGYYASGGTCHLCSVCPAGTRTAAACQTSVADTTCLACGPGTFSAAQGSTECAPCGSCDDGDACTEDRCDSKRGCVHALIDGCGIGVPGDAGGSPADPGGPIDDGADDSGPAEADTDPGDDGCAVTPSGRAGIDRVIPLLAAAALGSWRRRRSRRIPA